jgi:putative iron-regulated protein
MVLRPSRPALLLSAALLFLPAACSRQPPDDPRRPVVALYADLVLATYEDVVGTARELDQAIDALLARPTDATLNAARERWKAARVVYSQSEAFRFYAGPIDGEGGPESQVNGWPMDENHIDAVANGYNAAPGSDIVGNVTAFPQITPDLVAKQNEAGGEKNIASGYHAIEFLLWGQDLNDPPESTGHRPFTDYVVTDGSTTSVNARRGQYLKAASTLLVSDMESVMVQWRKPAAGSDNYRSKLVDGDVYTGLKRMITGMVALAEVEMAGERINVPLLSGDQEEEQSCFSDTTGTDLRNNAAGIENVYFAKYQKRSGGTVSGPSLADLVKQADPRVAEEMTARMERTREALKALHDPFDREIQPANAEGRARTQAVIDALRAEAQSFTRVATTLKIFLSPIESSGD